MRFKQSFLIPVAFVVAACSPSNGQDKGGKGHGPMGGPMGGPAGGPVGGPVGMMPH
jgi:hypothetical protein